MGLSVIWPAVAMAASTSDEEAAAAALIAIPFILIWLIWMLFIFLFWFLMMIFVFGGMILWVFMLVDVVRREFPKKDDKMVWVLILAFTGAIGAIIYYFVGRKQGKIVK